MNCANCSALLRTKKLISFHILNLLSLYYVLLGRLCHHHHHHHHHHFCHIVHITWRLFSILSILSCFCLFYSVLHFKVNKVVQCRSCVFGAPYTASRRRRKAVEETRTTRTVITQSLVETKPSVSRQRVVIHRLRPVDRGQDCCICVRRMLPADKLCMSRAGSTAGNYDRHAHIDHRVHAIIRHQRATFQSKRHTEN